LSDFTFSRRAVFSSYDKKLSFFVLSPNEGGGLSFHAGRAAIGGGRGLLAGAWWERSVGFRDLNLKHQTTKSFVLNNT